MTKAFARGTDVVIGYGGRTAVDRSSFTVPAGRITTLIGPNGSGKTTLLNALAGLAEPASGRLLVLGEQPAAVRTRLSYVLQDGQLPAGTPLTVEEAVGMARYASLGILGRRRREDRERVVDAMRQLDILHLAQRHLTELSGGQRQRVYVAQGVAQDRCALLLDEPLTGLDLVSARTIDAIIHAERDGGGTVVLTTHDLDEAMAADHVILMGGRVVSSGPPRSVLTQHNLEVAYGLGALHEHALFVDDPAHGSHPHAHESREPHWHEPGPEPGGLEVHGDDAAS